MDETFKPTIFFLIIPGHPRSSKYLVSRWLEPLKAFSGDAWGFKHLLNRYDHEIAQSLESLRNKPARINMESYTPWIFLIFYSNKTLWRNGGKGRLYAFLLGKQNRPTFRWRDAASFMKRYNCCAFFLLSVFSIARIFPYSSKII